MTDILQKAAKEPVASAALAIAILGAATILGAWYFQYGLGLQPCPLCLEQRYAYYFAIPLAVLAALGVSVGASRKAIVAAFIVIALGMLWNAGLGAYHAGVEWKFWPGPSTCAAAGSLNPADILDALDRPIHPPSCEDAAWRLAGISMAGYNALISAGLAGISLLAAFAPRTGDDLGRND